ncbi:hypothetical protein PHYSODRAFT_329765 [Phytophthora sojae]|uniref:Uncharacterized protein n=1 Tax=Phytophthora sojae (strain P6497) TaxID=1094619 RepID=G4Z8E8_PHYSP|nr:hypothetical protein PHYSODRAFT_329765 [Phytophthora sojae]EGZ21868.1 hypothetical protein PHYSODRAFT_329765 [Phytophthora sojae]|eukprot:XP_009524585.1 hypothetical protein PHYSODRAFT_329765 [Phytophthora sojae]
MRLRHFWKPELQTLFLAKKDGKWLSDRDEDVRALMENKTSKAMEEVLDDSNVMDPQRPLNDFNFPDIEDDSRGRWNERHVVLETPYNWSWHKRTIKRRLATAEQRRTGSSSSKCDNVVRGLSSGEKRAILWREAPSAVGKWISSYFPSKANSPKKAPWL